MSQGNNDTNIPTDTPAHAPALPEHPQGHPLGPLAGSPARGSDFPELASLLLTELRADRLRRTEEEEKANARISKLEELVLKLSERTIDVAASHVEIMLA
jgi:hypothetical protein